MNAVAVPFTVGDVQDPLPIIPCNLCGSQDGLERRRVKAMLAEWERESPGRTAQIFRSIRHVGPSHLADRELFDFETL